MSIAFFTTGIIAQAKGNKEIPQKVMTAFLSKYPSAHLKNWKINSEGYAAEFVLDKKKYFAHFSPNADWQKTETKINWTWKLPPAVKKALYHSDYASWYVNEIREIQTPGEHLYTYAVHVNEMAINSIRTIMMHSRKIS